MMAKFRKKIRYENIFAFLRAVWKGLLDSLTATTTLFTGGKYLMPIAFEND